MDRRYSARSRRDRPVSGNDRQRRWEHGSDGEAADGASTMETGTTSIGLTTREGVVLATDRRASILGGGFVWSKTLRKVEQVHPTGAMTLVGHIGDAHSLASRIRTKTSLYEVRRGEPMSADSLQRTAGTVAREMPVRNISPLLGVVDERGGHVARVDPPGGVIEDDYLATGSGMQPAYGMLEDHYEPGMSHEEAIDVATKTVRATSGRDAKSGDGLCLAEITDEGVDIRVREELPERS